MCFTAAAVRINDNKPVSKTRRVSHSGNSTSKRWTIGADVRISEKYVPTCDFYDSVVPGKRELNNVNLPTSIGQKSPTFFHPRSSCKSPTKSPELKQYPVAQ